MTGSAFHITGDTRGNVVVCVTISTVADVLHVEAADGGRVLLELGADEPVQVRITGPGRVLVDVLAAALAAVHQAVGGRP